MFGSGQIKKGETGEEQSQGMLVIFFNIKGTVHKELVLEGQTVSSTDYCNILW
jgi:hypothetical protein